MPRSHLALLLILGMTPSLEIAENVVHVVTEGHLAHAVDDADHEAEGPEHGCSGTMHVCPCHTSPVFDVVELRTGERLPGSAEPIGQTGPGAADGHVLSLLRPPIA